MRKPVRQAQWELSYRGVVPAPPGVVMVASLTTLCNTERAQRESRAKEAPQRGQEHYKGRGPEGHPPDYLSSFFGAAATRNGLKDLYLFAGTGVLDKMADVDDAPVAGVGALQAGVVRLYGVVIVVVGVYPSRVHSSLVLSVGRASGCC
jgi:hypothetical protein